MANDSNPSALYRNNHDGTFTDIGVASGCAYSQDGKPQAGMGVAIGDYDRNGTMDMFKTNFAGDTSTLYANTGGGFCEDRTFAAGIGLNTRWLGWGTGLVDLDNDGWLDLFLDQRPRLSRRSSQLKTEAGYKQRKVVYRNLGNGRFADISERLGSPVTDPEGRTRLGVRRLRQRRADGRRDRERQRPAGSLSPERRARRTLDDADADRHARRTATRSARACAAWPAASRSRQEVRGGGSYMSQNDFRVHFGLGRRDARRTRRGAVAERPRRELGESAGRCVSDAEGGWGPCSSARTDLFEHGRPSVARAFGLPRAARQPKGLRYVSRSPLLPASAAPLAAQSTVDAVSAAREADGRRPAARGD